MRASEGREEREGVRETREMPRLLQPEGIAITLRIAALSQFSDRPGK